ncbi:MAG: hypothetical protein KKD31_07680 [Bacteroidetes bacterium]|nr:hypothetical protein [Bacteroidota bacterium]
MRKFLLFAMGLIAFEIGNSQSLKTITEYWSTLKLKEKYTVVTQAPYYKQGKYEAFDSDGNITHSLNYNKGVLDGVQYFYLNDEGSPSSYSYCSPIRKPMHVWTYKNGDRVGIQKDYTCMNGKYFLWVEKNWGEKNTATRYFSTGKKMYVTEWIDKADNGSGSVEYYFPKGKLRVKFSYKYDGETYSGKYYEYSEQGELIIESNFSGKKNCWINNFTGYDLEYLTVGTNRDETKWIGVDNCKSCESCEYTIFEDGMKNTMTYSSGVLMSYPNGQKMISGDTTFFENGKIKSIGKTLSFYENGNKKGDGDTTFYESGQVETIGTKISYYLNGSKRHHNDTTFYTNGKVSTIGKDIKFYENGNLKTDGTNKFFENGKPEYTKDESYERTYNADGQLISETNLSTGEYSVNFPNGTRKKIVVYNKKGEINGWLQEFDENGNFIEFSFYVDGKKQDLTISNFYDVFKEAFGSIKKSEYISYGNKPLETYKPHSETKLLYYKGDMLLQSYKEKYSTETSKQKRLLLLKDVVFACSNLLEFAKNYTESMQQELKKTKSIEDIEGFLSYYESVSNQIVEVNQKYSSLMTDKAKAAKMSKDDSKKLAGDIKLYNKLCSSKNKLDMGIELIQRIEKLLN